MVRPTLLEETVAGQEHMAIGRREGLRKGELIGEIRVYQRVFKLAETPRETLWKMSLAKLRAPRFELHEQL